MTAKTISLYLGRLFLCSVVFITGSIFGGMVATLLGLQQPPMPEGVDAAFAFLVLSLASPLMMFALALIASCLGGGLISRALTLSFFAWVAYSLNTAVESLAFTITTVSGATFTTVSFLVPSFLCGIALAHLFPPGDQSETLRAIVKGFFDRRPIGAWIWRIGLAAVIFAPIYILFGTIVAPLTAEYFQESVYGLRQPSQWELLLVLLVRSVLFLLACLPIVVLWQGSNRALFLRLGFALFILVGFLYMLGAYYMPLEIRVPHTLEILAGSLSYSGILVALLASSKTRSVKTFKAPAIT